ncbi:hypothetical protein EYZ11_013355 [Aspergillus tanneri]|nr:hypothetical protein EYZ11_013355 [Aspergillus tanneri]
MTTWICMMGAKAPFWPYRHFTRNELRGSPLAILRVMDEFAAQNDFLINTDSNKADKVREIMEKEKPNVLVELGGYVGDSAISFGEAMAMLLETSSTILDSGAWNSTR